MNWIQFFTHIPIALLGGIIGGLLAVGALKLQRNVVNYNFRKENKKMIKLGEKLIAPKKG